MLQCTCQKYCSQCSKSSQAQIIYAMYKRVNTVHIIISEFYTKHEIFGKYNQILCSNQFGFKVKHSCKSQLLLIVHDFSHYMNKRLRLTLAFQISLKHLIKWHMQDSYKSWNKREATALDKFISFQQIQSTESCTIFCFT